MGQVVSDPSVRAPTTGDDAEWTPDCWRSRPVEQGPEWPDPVALAAALGELELFPPLVFAGESRRLVESLGHVADRRAFVLQAGDCAESFSEINADAIRDKLKVILQMAVVLTYGSGVPVVKIGRIAGQFAKPRSSPTEAYGDTAIPSFRGHIVHDDAPNLEARRPDPSRMIDAYRHAAATLNLLRTFTKGGFAALGQVHAWNQEFVATSREGRRYEETAEAIDRALRFLSACGVNLEADAPTQQVDLFTSHEALLLDFEESLTKRDPLTGDFYDGSAHMLWIGDRTRQLDGAHVAFLRGVHNPIGVKLGPSTTPDEAVGLCAALNPARVPGRLTLITRLGVHEVTTLLPPIVRAVTAAGHPVVWECDPMHGNTFVSENGRKTRHFDDVLGEIKGFFAVHRQEGSWPGGVHVELTGDAVTECLGGAEDILEEHLSLRYTTTCDPRLNGRQALDLAFRVAELLAD
ncbi:MAG TPA: 3-deoxy-7-phosphoheptulonate synthase class II [Acidimicrobiales bacterium]|nr:3-deoxy-7-phosphoheptulonate synthase class II [Acidimicrobiales bacterium]